VLSFRHQSSSLEAQNHSFSISILHEPSSTTYARKGDATLKTNEDKHTVAMQPSGTSFCLAMPASIEWCIHLQCQIMDIMLKKRYADAIRQGCRV
jgi:hypothetical protein